MVWSIKHKDNGETKHKDNGETIQALVCSISEYLSISYHKDNVETMQSLVCSICARTFEFS
jgi:hypothetical protein